MDQLPSEEERIAAIGRRVVRRLVQLFDRAPGEAESLFGSYHRRLTLASGWAVADYYDHEGAEAIALEVEFEFLFGSPRSQEGNSFLEWRKNFFGAEAMPSSSRERAAMWLRPWPNPSIERTSLSWLRQPKAAAHVKR